MRVLASNKKKTETKQPHTLLRILPLHLPHPLPASHTHVGFVDCFGFFIYLIKFRNTPANNLWLWNLHINPAKCCQIIELINIYLGQLPTPPTLRYPDCKACTFIRQQNFQSLLAELTLSHNFDLDLRKLLEIPRACIYLWHTLYSDVGCRMSAPGKGSRAAAKTVRELQYFCSPSALDLPACLFGGLIRPSITLM